MFFRHAVLLFFLIEAFTLFFVIGEIGFFQAMLCRLAAAICGVMLIQRQGLSMLMTVQKSFSGEAVPVDKFFDGFCIVVAGLLLILPGFISDILAIILLIPRLRNYIRGSKYNPVKTRTYTASSYGHDVIDGSYVRVEETVEMIEQNSDNSSKPPPSS